jgi:hypothetical protein
MNKLLIVSILATLFAAGCSGVKDDKDDDKDKTYFSKSEFPSESTTIYGAWESLPDSTKTEYRLFFNRKNLVAVEMICDEDKAEVRATAMGSAIADVSKISILQGLSGTADNKNGVSCSFMFGAYQSPYTIQGEILTLQAAPDNTGSRSFRRFW